MLNKIADCIKENKNIIEKKEIDPIVDFIESTCFKSQRIFSDIGEDSAAIKNNNDMYTLITTDRIKTTFIENFPFGAGFSSILVGVDDIYACGGIPTAASIIISFKEQSIGQEIIKGVCEGSNKFRVPIVRGHTNTKDYYELSTTVIGEIRKEHYISAKNAQVNDNIILAIDPEGRIGKANRLYWDTTTFKPSNEVVNKRKAMNVIAEKKLATASKDISNGGIFGTLLQLSKYSNVGANVNINDIKIPKPLMVKDYSLETFVMMYLTTSYILTAPNDNCQELIRILNQYGLDGKVIGRIIKDKGLLQLNDGKATIDVLKF